MEMFTQVSTFGVPPKQELYTNAFGQMFLKEGGHQFLIQNPNKLFEVLGASLGREFTA